MSGDVADAPVRYLPPQRGDEAELFERHGERLVRLVRSTTGASRQVAEDACSFAWIQLLRHQPERDAIFPWLRVVATREAVRLLKRQLRDGALDEDSKEAPAGYVDRRTDLQLAVDAHEALEQIAGLTPQQVQIFSLHIAGLTYDEICEATGYSWRQVDRHMQRARAWVRAATRRRQALGLRRSGTVKRTTTEHREEARQKLERAVEALAKSDGWRAWMRTRSTFRRYSLHNTILIAMQRPEATRVAGYRAWQRLGRQVQRGEKAIAILAPMTYRERDDDGSETGEVRRLFRAVHVFDISQTVGDPLPEPPREPITGESHGRLLPRLAAFAEGMGYSVAYESTGAAALGYCDRITRRIVVAPDQPANARVRTLIHELAHALGVGYADYGREAAEVIVESAATIACASAGLDTSGESIPYIARWGDSSTDALREYAAKVDELAGRLERACGVEAERMPPDLT